MKFYCILNRRLLVLTFLIASLIILFVGQFKSYAVNNKNGDTHKKRMDYISGLGYSVDEDSAEEKQIVIPYVFSDVYENYNNIQNSAGFDLTKYKGRTVTSYSYTLADCPYDAPKCINLLVCDGTIIGGDVCSLSLDGEMLPLIKIGE